jgi:hypothetical protein
LIEPRTQLLDVIDKKMLQDLGYKVPLESVWPVGGRVKATADWWREPEAWISTIVELLGATWPLVAPPIDRVLPGESQVTDG